MPYDVPDLNVVPFKAVPLPPPVQFENFAGFAPVRPEKCRHQACTESCPDQSCPFHPDRRRPFGGGFIG